MLWNVTIVDSVYYPNIEAETEEQAIDIAYEYFHERSHDTFVERSNEQNENI